MKIKSFVEWMIEKRLNEEGEIVSVRWVHVLIDEWARHLKEDGVHQGDCTSESQPCEMCHIEMYLTEYYDYMKNFNKSKKISCNECDHIGGSRSGKPTCNCFPVCKVIENPDVNQHWCPLK